MLPHKFTLIYGMNIIERSYMYFIVTQYYGNESFQGITLQKVISQDVQASISGSEHWLQMIAQLIDGLSYLHSKGILLNDIKNDSIVIVYSANCLFCPVLVDFGSHV